ncbi:MAG: hypothetical protein HQK55_00405 [Deltaproteobacteria bacterium]|nr:hypothetical protein [Deltaproteobacteria bacterium]
MTVVDDKSTVSKNSIEIIPGSNRVIVVAPHGFEGTKPGEADDEKTGKLARLLSEKFGFYAIINEVFKRIEKQSEAKPGKYLINCARIDQLEIYLKNEFLTPLLKIKKEIKANYGNPLIVHIHGIKDKNIKKAANDPNAAILIGYGPQDKRNGKSIYSADDELIDKFINLLVKSEIPITAKKAGPLSNYQAGELNNLNQLFRTEEYKDEDVQSFQLEIKHGGYRDKNENAEKAANAIGAALLRLIEAEEKQFQVLPALVEKAVVVSPVEENDTSLVEEAYRTISAIISCHLESAMLEAGRYIIKKFYNNDMDMARKKKAVKAKPLYQLIKLLHKSDDGAPSKSWIYNAVNLAVDTHDLEDFHTYGKLSLSQKVLLLPVRDLEQKKVLITEIVEQDYTISQLRDRLKELDIKDQKPPVHKADLVNLIKLIDKPQILFADDANDLLNKIDFSKLDIEKIIRMQTQVDQKTRELQRYLKGYDQLAEMLNNIEKQRKNSNATKARQ